MSNKRVAVIMAGGSGERFWPLSRRDRPKQLLKLASPEESMLEQAANRIKPLVGPENVYVATGVQLVPAIKDAHVVPAEHIIAEPSSRNTLGGLSWGIATLLSQTQGKEDLTLAVLPADHKIEGLAAFLENVDIALATAENTEGLVTIGIKPTRPDTGYGYIEYETSGDGSASSVKRFHEKPDADQAKEYLQKNFLWNSGMFFWTIRGFLTEMEQHQPEVHNAILEIAEALRNGNADQAQEIFETIPVTSIDYALLEKSENVHVVPASFDWDDLGSLDSLQRAIPLDEHKNAVRGEAVLLDTEGCVIYNELPGSKICVMGMEDIVVVATDDAILVCPKADAQQVRRIYRETEKHRKS